MKNNVMTVGKWILTKVDTKNWRMGNGTGSKHYSHGSNSERSKDSLYEMREAVGGRQVFLEQVRELDKKGLIAVKYENVNTDVREISVTMEQIDALYEFEKMENPKKIIAEKKSFLDGQKKRICAEWLLEYYNFLYGQLEKGTISENLRDESIFSILNAIAGLESDVWKRKFSSDVLGDSKLFEKKYEKRILTILRDFSLKEEGAAMEDTEVLAEHKILTYSQTLEWKGNVRYRIGHTEIDSAPMRYGTVLNAQTLSHAQPISLEGVKQIITIENKANYESMTYQPDTLYIYTHGFPSPKERIFLEKLEKLADATVAFFHWGDMDYGGIRIFQFLKKNLFPRILPLLMDRNTYEKALKHGRGSPLEEEKRKKLIKLEAGELEDLKQCILQYGAEFEQESILGHCERRLI